MANRYFAVRTYPDWVHHELQNWARWCWLGPSPVPQEDRCKSLECNYSRISEEGDKAERRIMPHIENAQIVQSAFERMPGLQRKILIIEYPKKYLLSKGRSIAARALGITRTEYESALFNAACKVETAFEVKK